MRDLKSKISSGVRVSTVAISLGLAVAVCPPVTPQAQRARESEVNVTGISTRASGKDAVVSIAADAPLSRAQTWQDEEGFHIVVYKGRGAFLSGVPRGVKVRRVGDSLELIMQAKPGSNVLVKPRFNTLDLIVSGGLRSAPGGETERAPASNSRADERAQAEANEQHALSASAKSRMSGTQGANAHQVRESGAGVNEREKNQPQQTLLAPPDGFSFPAGDEAQRNATQRAGHTLAPFPTVNDPGKPNFNQPFDETASSAATQNAVPPSATSAQITTSGQSESGAGLFTVLAICLAAGFAVFMLLFMRGRRRATLPELEENERGEWVESEAAAGFQGDAQTSSSVKQPRQSERRGGRRGSGRRSDDRLALMPGSGAGVESLEKSARKIGAPVSANVPAVLFGAYRIDQEVEKLVAGETHAIEVLSSRAIDDRRAIEASLLKALHSNTLGEAQRERARTALEEYGFVARHSASVLLAPDAYERSSAARALGEMRSRASLPFLLEALYDAEQTVCAEVVKSLGALALPSAIGALLDMARRHPDLPPALLGRALSACSVDCLNLQSGVDADSFALPEGMIDPFTGEIRGLEPVEAVEQLPEWLEDETLADALERLGSADMEARLAAAQQLSQFQVRRSVEALAAMATTDPDAMVRAAAITSLGSIGHESVFPSVIIAMADEAREVRAAAARALSRLSFDRADAYARAVEGSDAAMLRRLADACVGAGLANQALKRLASDDRRQAYEAFSLLSVVAKGGQSELILKVVEEHQELSVRLAAARLLGLMGDAELDKRLRRIALGANAPEKLRTAILEAVYRGEGMEAEAAAQVLEVN